MNIITQYHSNNHYKQLLPGGLAGFTGVLIGYPLDTVKVRMQTGFYPHMKQCITETIHKEGFRAFYRGAAVPFASLTIKRGYQYYLFNSNQKSPYKILQNPFVSGALSGIIGTPIGCPMHVIKIRMQNSDINTYKNLKDCLMDIYKLEGIKGFYSGFRINLIKDLCFGGLYLGTMGYLSNIQKNNKTYFKKHEYQSNMFSLFKGGVAGCATWTILFPIDSIKTMIQSGLGFKIFKTNIKKLGIFYMWRGLKPVLIRTFPASAMSIFVYDKAIESIDNDITY